MIDEDGTVLPVSDPTLRRWEEEERCYGSLSTFVASIIERLRQAEKGATWRNCKVASRRNPHAKCYRPKNHKELHGYKEWDAGDTFSWEEKPEGEGPEYRNR